MALGARVYNSAAGALYLTKIGLLSNGVNAYEGYH